MTVSTVDQIQSDLMKTACPSCGTKELDLRLRCDLGQGECLYLIKCARCGTNYAVAAQTKRLASHQPTTEDLLSTLTCAHCASTKTELGFQCDLTSKECFYTITCKACGKPIKEYR